MVYASVQRNGKASNVRSHNKFVVPKRKLIVNAHGAQED